MSFAVVFASARQQDADFTPIYFNDYSIPFHLKISAISVEWNYAELNRSIISSIYVNNHLNDSQM